MKKTAFCLFFLMFVLAFSGQSLAQSVNQVLGSTVDQVQPVEVPVTDPGIVPPVGNDTPINADAVEGVILPDNIAATSGLLVDYGTGRVDWGDGRVSSSHNATIIETGLPARDEAMAIRKATVQARKGLLELILSLPYDSSRVVDDYLSKNRSAGDEVRGAIRNSMITREKMSDGSYVVSAWVDMRGALADRIIPAAEPFLSIIPPKVELDPIDRDLANLAAQVALEDADPEDLAYRRSLAELGGYSGVVIDARGLGAMPAIMPLVVDENGLAAYGSYQVGRKAVLDKGMAVYVSNPGHQLIAERGGGKPFRVRALAAVGEEKADLVIASREAELMRLIVNTPKVRDNCAVVVIMDAPEIVEPEVVSPEEGNPAIVMPENTNTMDQADIMEEPGGLTQ